MSSIKIKHLILAISLFFLVQSSLAQQKTLLIDNDFCLLKGEKKTIKLEDYLEIFVDTSNRITFENIQQKNVQNQFVALQKWEEKLLRDNTYWLRIKINRTSSRNKFVILNSIEWDIDNLFIKQEDGHIYRQQADFVLPITINKIEHSKFFDVDLGQEKEVEIYFKLRYNRMTPKLHELKIYDKIYYHKRATLFKILYAASLAIILVMIFYHLIFYLIVKQMEYLFYVIMLSGFMGAFGIYFFQQSFSHNYLFALVELFFYVLATIGLVGFTKRYFETHREIKPISQSATWGQVAMFVVFIVHSGIALNSDIYPYYTQNVILAFVVIQIVQIYIIIISSVREKKREAYYFFVATFLVTLIGLYVVMTVGRILHFSTQTEAKQFLLAGVLVQIVMYSLAMGNRVLKLKAEAAEAVLINLDLANELNEILERKVASRTAEISEKNKELRSQRDIERKQKQEITDSILYAEKIQQAILPKTEFIQSIVAEHFILFKPRDIVSGDFYWIKQIKNYTIIATADCTGHGIPGAFMSMLGAALLNEVVTSRSLDNPGEILNRLRNRVKKVLQQEGVEGEADDGMDIALYIVDMESLKLEYAGAYNSLYIIRTKNNTEEFIVLKADRQPISIHLVEKEFTNHSVQLQKGDCLYTFSDGFVDQFGGENMEKFKIKRFKEKLLSIYRFPMDKQCAILDNTLETWQGENEQVDDILVVGMRI